MRRWFWALLLVPATARAEWGLGLRTSAQAVTTNADPRQQIALVGGGLQLRWRFSRHFGVELDSEDLAGDAAGGAFHRESKPVTLALVYHFTPGSAWDFYGLLGLGGADDTVTFTDKDGMSVEQDFQESHVRLGAGVERRFGPFGVAAELHVIGMARQDRDAALPADAIPPQSSAGQLTLAGTYYF